MLRFKMYFLLRKIDRALDEEELGDESAYPQLMKTLRLKKNRRALLALRDVDAIVIDYGDNGFFEIGRGSRSRIYFLERSELWVNRIMAFLSGVATAVIVEWLIRHISL